MQPNNEIFLNQVLVYSHIYTAIATVVFSTFLSLGRERPHLPCSWKLHVYFVSRDCPVLDFDTNRIIMWVFASGIFTKHRCKAHPCSSTWRGQFFSLLSWGFFYLCCCSVTKSCPALCDPIDCSTPGFPVHHQLPALAQTHVHRVSNAIQPSRPHSSPSPPARSLSQHRGLF